MTGSEGLLRSRAVRAWMAPQLIVMLAWFAVITVLVLAGIDYLVVLLAVIDPQRELVGLPAPLADVPLGADGLEDQVSRAEQMLGAIISGAMTGGGFGSKATERAIAELRIAHRWLSRRPKDEPAPELSRWTGSRALTPREAEILAFLLAADDERLEPLRRQAETATVSGGCGCGCPSIDLAVDRARSSPATGLGRPAVSALSREEGPGDEVWWLHLWVEDGWLEGIELSYLDTPPSVLPAPDVFSAPVVEPAAAP